MDTFNLHVENYLFAKFRNIWPKAIFHKDSAGGGFSFLENLFQVNKNIFCDIFVLFKSDEEKHV